VDTFEGSSYGGPRPGGIKVNLLVWDVVGGSAAVVLLVGLIVHFRWSYWQSLSQQAPAPNGTLLDRIRQGVQETGRQPTSSGGIVAKPNARSYSRVESQERGGFDGESEVDDVEMI
jgi:hypothetical protein